MSHHIRAVAVGCFDFRLRDPRTAWSLQMLLANVDLIRVAGSSLCVSHTVTYVSDVDSMTHEIRPEVVIDQLHLSVTAHHPHEIWLLPHQDCAVTKMLEITYEGISQKEERAALKKQYRYSAQIIAEEFGLPVKIFYQTLRNGIYRL